MSYSIDKRNEDFVNFAAAFYGRISPNVRAIDFSASGPASFQCSVILRIENREDRAAIAEALEDFEAIRRPAYELPFDMQCKVVVSEGRIEHPCIPTLRLFAAREE